MHAPVLTVPQVSEEVFDRVFELVYRLVLLFYPLVLGCDPCFERLEPFGDVRVRLLYGS